MGKHDLKGNSVVDKLLSYIELGKYDDVMRVVMLSTNKTFSDNIFHLTKETPVIERKFNCFTVTATTEAVEVYFHGDFGAVELDGKLYIDTPSCSFAEELLLSYRPHNAYFEPEELSCVDSTAPFYAGWLNVTHEWDYIDYGDVDDDIYRLIIIMDSDISDSLE